MKRPNGYGTVTRLSGTRRKPYAARVPARDRKGHITQKYLGYYETQCEAFEALEAYRAQYAAGQAPAPDALGVTVQQVYDLWSARKYKEISKSQALLYGQSWKRLSRYAALPIRTIGIDQWQALVDEVETDGKSATLAGNLTTLIHALNAYASERDWITKDYSRFIRIPKIAPKVEKGIFNDFDLKRLEQLAASGFPGADSVLVLCLTGFRIREFLALTQFSYDSEEKTLTGGSKTEAGKDRVIPVHPKIQPIIAKWYAAGGNTLYTYKGKPISYGTYLKQIFHPLMDMLNKPAATPHWCRHTFASMLHAAGADELNIKRLMGHANRDVTDHYTHVALDELRRTIALLTA